MAVYVIYDRDNGRIVHTHVQPEDLPIDREGLIALLDRRQDVTRLAIVLVDPDQVKEDYLYRVDPTSRELQQVDSPAATGFGVGAVTYANSDWSGGPRKITYSRGDFKERLAR